MSGVRGRPARAPDEQPSGRIPREVAPRAVLWGPVQLAHRPVTSGQHRAAAAALGGPPRGRVPRARCHHARLPPLAEPLADPPLTAPPCDPPPPQLRVDGGTDAVASDRDDIPVRDAWCLAHLDHWGGAPLRAEAGGRVWEVGVTARLAHARARRWHHPVAHGRHPEGAFPSVRWGEIDPPHRRRSVAPSPQVVCKRLEPGGDPLPLGVVALHRVDAGTAALGAPGAPGSPPQVGPAQAGVERRAAARPAPLGRLVARELAWSCGIARRWLALAGRPRPCPPRGAWLQPRSCPPSACCGLADRPSDDRLRRLTPPSRGLRLLSYPRGDRGCGPLPAGALPCATVACPSLPFPRRRSVRRGGTAGVFTPSLACASPDRLGSPWSLAGSHPGAAGCTCGDGRRVGSSCAEGDAASAPSVRHEHWAPATWLSGHYHGRTYTGTPTVPCKAHHAGVRRPRHLGAQPMPPLLCELPQIPR